jgi:hypothetical protein
MEVCFYEIFLFGQRKIFQPVSRPSGQASSGLVALGFEIPAMWTAKRANQRECQALARIWPTSSGRRREVSTRARPTFPPPSLSSLFFFFKEEEE